MQFTEVIGQNEIKGRLVRSVTGNRISHAQMFFGPPGSGKLSLAIAYTQFISCVQRGEEDSCGICPSCVKIQKLVHPDLHFVFPVMTTAKVVKDPVSDHFIEEWREIIARNPYLSENQWYEAIGAENKQGIISRQESNEIIRKLGFKSYESEYKIVIIWLPEKMNPPAASALLKLIEEPPQNTLFLMVSENTDQILPTILSRTQLIHVPLLTAPVIREGLERKGYGNRELIEDAIGKANGNFNIALSVMEDDEQELKNFENFVLLMRLSFQRKIVEINDWVEGMAVIGRERQKRFLEYALRLIRENFMLNLKKEEISYMAAREEEFSKKFSAFIHPENIAELSEEFTLAYRHIEANGYPRVIFMDLAIQVIKLLKKEPDIA